MPLRIIIWAAVSTPEQASDEKESIPAQIEQARKTIQERSWYEVAEPLVVPGHTRYITWLAIFEHNYQPRVYRYNEDVTILRVGDSELDFNHPEGAFSIWWQSGRRNVRVWAR